MISVTSAFSTAFSATRPLCPSDHRCDQRGILQHLLRTLLLLLTGAENRCSRGVQNTGGDLLDCCAADCLGVWVVVLNSCSATMYGLRVFLWCIGILDYIGHHSLLTEVSTGVLWVSTGTHPCGLPSRQDDGGTRAPALHTLDDVLRSSRRCGL